MHKIDPESGMAASGGFGLRTALLAIGVALGGAALMAFLDEQPVEVDGSGGLLPVELREPRELTRLPEALAPDVAPQHCRCPR